MDTPTSCTTPGAFQIGLGVTLGLAVLWGDPLAVALTGFLVVNTIHAVNHAVDLDLGGNGSDPWLLGAVSLLSAVALVRRLGQLHHVVGPGRNYLRSPVGAVRGTEDRLVDDLPPRRHPGRDPAESGGRWRPRLLSHLREGGEGEAPAQRLARGADPVYTRGTPTGRGAPLCARARRVEGAEHRHAARLLTRKYPLLHGVVVPLSHRLGRAKFGRTVHYELHPLAM